MQIEGRGLIFDASKQPDSRRIAFFSSLCRLESGTILAGFQVGPSKHAPTSSIGLCRSGDGGASWHELSPAFETRSTDGRPGSLAAAEMVEAEPGRLLLFTTWFDRSEPARPLFDPVTEGILHSRQLVASSTDEGDSWSAWQTVPTPGLAGCATTGPPVRWRDGTIAHAFESFKEYDDPRPGHHAAWVALSRDGGRTFGEPLLVARHPEDRVYYWDQRLCAAGGPREYVALFWTHDLDQRRDLHVHIRRATVFDMDFRTAPIRETSIAGQIAAPLLLDDGRLLAFVVDRHRPGTLKLWSSPDRGGHWPEGDCLLIHTHLEQSAVTQGTENVDFKQYWEDMGKWSFGHPAILQLSNDRVLLAWYAGSPDCMSLHWARVRL
ncbi:MAG: sialidase family protein [Pirellulales bacterium]